MEFFLAIFLLHLSIAVANRSWDDQAFHWLNAAVK
jgi:hypothetical protein